MLLSRYSTGWDSILIAMDAITYTMYVCTITRKLTMADTVHISFTSQSHKVCQEKNKLSVPWDE